MAPLATKEIIFLDNYLECQVLLICSIQKMKCMILISHVCVRQTLEYIYQCRVLLTPDLLCQKETCYRSRNSESPKEGLCLPCPVCLWHKVPVVCDITRLLVWCGTSVSISDPNSSICHTTSQSRRRDTRTAGAKGRRSTCCVGFSKVLNPI